MSEDYDYLFKSIVVGDGGVGKTALTLRFSKDFFTEDYKMTIGVDFHVKTITIDTAEGPIRAKLQLWDTGGQERFSSIRPMYYRGSLGAVLVFDLTNSSSFEHLPQWIQEVRANIKTEIPILLVGNKSDLVDQRAVSLEEINNFTRDFNLYYMETSAKTGEGVGDCFYILACLMVGQGVPEQLVANATVYSPGQIPLDSTSLQVSTKASVSALDDYEAPPVPNIDNTYESSLDDYSAPPVPEPVINYEAPPVPEPISEKKMEESPFIEPESEPEISVPEPTEFEFKTPDEIFSEERQKSDIPTLLESSEEVYKPKAVPFSSNEPIPAPTPEQFKFTEEPKEDEPNKSMTPFRVSKKEDAAKPKPSMMSFEVPNQALEQENQTTPSNDMPEGVLSKKEKKRMEKERKKEKKKKKLLEDKEKQEKLLHEMVSPKKEKPKATSEPPPLFDALTQKTEHPEAPPDSFIPFTSPTEKHAKREESSHLRIIPNVADTEPETSSFRVIRNVPEQEVKQEPKSKDFLICDQCG
ncbi:MAG: GTP-binding protein, partial [Promethearchaeota archaeon]